jgi:hypothetical protein
MGVLNCRWVVHLFFYFNLFFFSVFFPTSVSSVLLLIFLGPARELVFDYLATD